MDEKQDECDYCGQIRSVTRVTWPGRFLLLICEECQAMIDDEDNEQRREMEG